MIQGVVSARTIKPNTEMTASVQENRIKTHKTLKINAFSMSTRHNLCKQCANVRHTLTLTKRQTDKQI